MISKEWALGSCVSMGLNKEVNTRGAMAQRNRFIHQDILMDKIKISAMSAPLFTARDFCGLEQDIRSNCHYENHAHKRVTLEKSPVDAGNIKSGGCPMLVDQGP